MPLNARGHRCCHHPQGGRGAGRHLPATRGSYAAPLCAHRVRQVCRLGTPARAPTMAAISVSVSTPNVTQAPTEAPFCTAAAVRSACWAARSLYCAQEVPDLGRDALRIVADRLDPAAELRQRRAGFLRCHAGGGREQ